MGQAPGSVAWQIYRPIKRMLNPWLLNVRTRLRNDRPLFTSPRNPAPHPRILSPGSHRFSPRFRSRAASMAGRHHNSLCRKGVHGGRGRSGGLLHSRFLAYWAKRANLSAGVGWLSWGRQPVGELWLSANLIAISALTSHKLPDAQRIKPGDEVITVALVSHYGCTDRAGGGQPVLSTRTRLRAMPAVICSNTHSRVAKPRP